MQELDAQRIVAERSSPAGRTIKVRASGHVQPDWIARRRKADRLIDKFAAGAKRVVRRWLVPRPAGAPRRFSQSPKFGQ